MCFPLTPICLLEHMTFHCVGRGLCTAPRGTGKDGSGVEMQPLLGYQGPFSNAFSQRRKAL